MTVRLMPKNSMLTVSLVEDDEQDRELWSHTICSTKDLRLLSVYSNAEDALNGLPREKPDVILMDINLPRMNGIECLWRLRRIVPAIPTHVIMLTESVDSDLVFQALEAGAHGYLVKNVTSGKLLYAAIREVVSGGAPMSPQIARKVISHFEGDPRPTSSLSARQQEVLLHLSNGLVYKEIADELSISVNTVRKHIGLIYGTLHVHSRTEAAVRYVQSATLRSK